jgi:hypothetical protein
MSAKTTVALPTNQRAPHSVVVVAENIVVLLRMEPAGHRQSLQP